MRDQETNARADDMRKYQKLKKTELVDIISNYGFAVQFIQKQRQSNELTEGLLTFILDDLDRRNKAVLASSPE